MEKRLELLFINSLGKNTSLTISDPKAGLTPEDIKAAMDQLVQAGLVEVEGVQRYQAVRGARYVTRQVDEIFTQEPGEN